jgi:tetratricopeptide (TPR) repeat protein
MKRKPTPGMVTGGEEPMSYKILNFLRTKWGRVLIVVLALALTLAVVGVVYYFSPPKKETITAEKKVVTDDIAEGAAERAYNGDYAGAQQSIDKNVAKTSDKNEKLYGYMTQATLAMNSGKYDEARQYALKAEQAKPTDGTAELLGDVATAQGDKQAAQKYYQQALERLEERAKTAPSPSIPQMRKTITAKLEKSKS